MPKKKTFFAISKSGDLYVKVDAVMHPIIPAVDGLTVAFFGKKSKTPYLKVEDAIEWCKKEMNSHGKEKYEIMIAVMERAIRENPKPLEAEKNGTA